MAEVYKNSSGPYVQSITEPNQFLRNWLPVEYSLKSRIAERLLPAHLYEAYVIWKHQESSRALVAHICKSLDTTLNLRWREVGNNAPKYYDYEAQSLEGESISFGQSFRSAGEAESRCLGEFLERQFLKNIDVEKTVVTTKRKLGHQAAEISTMPTYLPWQMQVDDNFATRNQLSDTPITWIKARSMLHGRKKYIPANRVFWGQFDRRSKSLNQPTSNGNGGGFTLHEAALSGLYELIERDSFMCHWLLQLPATVIDMQDVTNTLLEQKLASARRYKLEVVFLNITTSIGVPTLLCIIFDRHEKDDVKISVGAAAGYDTDRLFEKSYLEALVVLRRHWFKTSLGFTKANFGERGLFDNKTFDASDWETRLDGYRGVIAERQLDFLLQGKHSSYQAFSQQYKRNFTSSKLEYLFIKKRFTELSHSMPGLHPYIYEAHDKNRLLRSLGYHVVSVVSPQLFPLYLTEHHATLDVSTLNHWRSTAEAAGQEWIGGIKNLFPHPFP